MLGGEVVEDDVVVVVVVVVRVEVVGAEVVEDEVVATGVEVVVVEVIVEDVVASVVEGFTVDSVASVVDISVRAHSKIPSLDAFSLLLVGANVGVIVGVVELSITIVGVLPIIGDSNAVCGASLEFEDISAVRESYKLVGCLLPASALAGLPSKTIAATTADTPKIKSTAAVMIKRRVFREFSSLQF